VLGGNEELAGEGGFRGAAVQGFFRADARDIGVVIFLRDVRQHKVAGVGVETVGVGEEFANRVIGEMSGAGKDALLDYPGIGTDLEHIEVVIGFKDHAIGVAEVNFNEFRHVAEVGTDGYLDAVGAEGEGDGISGVMRDGKSVNVDVTDRKTLTSMNGLDTTKAFAKGLRQRALERAHGWFGDVERRLPDAENLRKTVAVIGVFVGDEDGVEGLNVTAYCSQARKGFAFAEASVDEDASIFGFKEG